MQRIPYTPIDDEILKRIRELGSRPLNLYKLLAHQSYLLSAWLEFAFVLRNHCKTSRELRELMILRGAQVSKSEYECQQHLRMAKEAGVTEDKITELSNWNNSSKFSNQEKAALRFMESQFVWQNSRRCCP